MLLGNSRRGSRARVRQKLALLLAGVVCLAVCTTGHAGVVQSAAVGGVVVDTEGVLSNPTTNDLAQLKSAWQAGLQRIPADLDDPADMRFVSLAKLEATIAECRVKNQPLPDEVTYLAGLQRITHVLVYPDRNDIVLAGPAEGWKMDSRGNVVGATSGHPVLLLDDLMTALRSAKQTGETGISCSIEPTDEGMQRSQQIARQQKAGMDPALAAKQLEEALGPQSIIVTGISETSHFARVIVAADFRMKRLAMNFDPAPVDGLPSYLHMASASRRRSNNLTPRWWLAANYDSLHRDAEGLAWELSGQGVKCLTEQDAIARDGSRAQTGKVDPIAKKWADAFTERFTELAREDSTFGQLRNVMDLAVVAALIAKENLAQRAGLEFPRLMGEELLEQFNAPRQVASQASFIKKRGGTLISISGGVQLDPWFIADQTETDETLATTRTAAPAGGDDQWWWNGE